MKPGLRFDPEIVYPVDSGTTTLFEYFFGSLVSPELLLMDATGHEEHHEMVQFGPHRFRVALHLPQGKYYYSFTQSGRIFPDLLGSRNLAFKRGRFMSVLEKRPVTLSVTLTNGSTAPVTGTLTTSPGVATASSKIALQGLAKVEVRLEVFLDHRENPTGAIAFIPENLEGRDPIICFIAPSDYDCAPRIKVDFLKDSDPDVLRVVVSKTGEGRVDAFVINRNRMIIRKIQFQSDVATAAVISSDRRGCSGWESKYPLYPCLEVLSNSPFPEEQRIILKTGDASG